MAIDTTGKWWIGDRPEDLDEHLRAYSADGDPTSEFRLARCDCGCAEFPLEADDIEGVARRTCTECGKRHFVCDSAGFWEEAEPEKWKCVCKGRAATSVSGFALYEDG